MHVSKTQHSDPDMGYKRGASWQAHLKGMVEPRFTFSCFTKFNLTEGLSRVTAAMNRLQSQMQALVDERLMSERRRQIEDLATKVVTLEADRREAKSELRATEQRHQAEIIGKGHRVSMACCFVPGTKRAVFGGIESW